MPAGALLMGTLGEHLGSPMAIHITSLITLSVSIGVFIFVPSIRRLK
jgi:ABC-type Fe3+-siderophore transport system permease subunit